MFGSEVYSVDEVEVLLEVNITLFSAIERDVTLELFTEDGRATAGVYVKSPQKEDTSLIRTL